MTNRVLLTLMAVLTLGAQATAMDPGGAVGGPERLVDCKNKMLLIEYTNALGAQAGRQIAQLTGQMVLANISDVPSFGVVTLQQPAEKREMTATLVEEEALRQKTPVVVWGEFYEQDEKIFIVSRLRVFDGAAKTAQTLRLVWPLNDLNIPGKASARATAPASEVSFAPMEISRQSLQKLQKVWDSTRELRRHPDSGSVVTGKLPPDAKFFLWESSDGWSRVKVEGGDSGWVQFNELSAKSDFKELFAVVLYAKGMMQYLAGQNEPAAKTFEQYLSEYGDRQDAINRALARVVLGYAYINDAKREPGERTKLALEQFRKSAELLPSDASPVNCQAVATFVRWKKFGVSGDEVRRLEKDLVHVIRTENDAEAAANLQVLYQAPGAAELFQREPASFKQASESRLKLLAELETKFRATQSRQKQ